MTEVLATDSGSSNSDKITNVDTLTGSGDANAVVTLMGGTTVLGTATADANGTWSFTPTTLAQGTHTVVASETDAAGNVGTASLSFTYDTVAASVTEVGTDSGIYNNDRLTNIDKLTGSGDANAVVTLTDGTTILGTKTADANGTWSFTPTTLAQGTHTVVASETDAAGNVGTASLSFTYDTVPPVATVALGTDTGSPTDQITSNDALTGTGTSNEVLAIMEGSALLGLVTVNALGSWSLTPTWPLSQGTHTITVGDLAGNIGTAALTFTYDTWAPQVSIYLTNDPEESQAEVESATAYSSGDDYVRQDALSGTGEPGGVVTLKDGTTVLGTATVTAGGTWSFTPASLSQGLHTIVASETDVAGNVGVSGNGVFFVYDSQAPTVSVGLASDTGTPGDKVTSNDTLTGTGDAASIASVAGTRTVWANAIVRLTEGTSVLGTTTANAGGTWSFTPAALAQGTHTIIASETDYAGNVGTASLSFTYDSLAPAVTEALGTDTGRSSTDRITSAGTLTGGGDPSGVVTLKEGTRVIGTATADGSGTWSFVPTSLAQGTHTIVASETDLAGNVGSASLAFTYDTVAATVTERLSSDTGTSSSDKITANAALTGSGDANATVTLREGTVTLGSALANGAGTWSFTPTSLAQGTHTIVASETDTAGNVGASAPLTFTYDTLAPAVTELLGTDTGTPGDNVTSVGTLTGSGDPGAVVRLTEGGNVIGTATANGSGTWSFVPSSLSQGLHTIVASETDAAGNVNTASLRFTYDSIAPAVTAALVSDTGSSTTDRITSNGQITGKGDLYAVVTLQEGANTLGTAKADSAGRWVFTPTSLAQGTHTIVASETDAAGNVGTGTVAFTYDTIAPAVTVLLGTDTGTPSDNQTSIARLTGSGDANAVVTLMEGPFPIGTATANASGTWSFTPTSLAAGAHTIVAMETDAAGNVGSSSLSFTYTPTPTGYSVASNPPGLASLQGTSGLNPGTVANLSQTGGNPGDSFNFSLAAGSSSGLALSNGGALSVTPSLAGAAGGKVYVAIPTITDAASGLSKTGGPLDVVVGDASNNTINLRTLGIAATTPAFIYGLGGADTISGAGMTSQLWFVGGAGADTMTGGSGANAYLYGAVSESTSAAMDIIANFNASKDLIDLTGLGGTLASAGALSGNLAAHSVGWQASGGNTFVYVNTSGSSEALASTDMKIELLGTPVLTSANFHRP